MTLEDFFTLTEMKDGLRALSRVKELVSVMQKEKDCVVNGGDTIRQWTAVASIISATENKDCLDLFVQLGGLFFIDKWLKVAEELVGNPGDGFVEELITALLLALEKLCTDKSRSVDSIQPGISSTLKNLFVHCSLRVRDVATNVFENLELGDRDTICNTESVAVVDPINGSLGSSEPKCSVQGEDQCMVNGNSDSIKAETMPLPISNGLETPKADAVPSVNGDCDLQSHVQPPLDLPAPLIASDVESRAFEENALPVEENPTIPPIDEGMENVGSTPASAAIDAVENSVPSNVNPSTESVLAGSSVEAKVEVVTEDNLCQETATVLDLRETKVDIVSNSKSEKDEDVVTQKGKNVRDGDCGPETIEKPSRYRDFGSVSILHTLGMDNKNSSKLGHGKKSVIELDYGIDDALEVARQVAQEVEVEMSSEDSGRGSCDVITKSSSLDSFERQAMEANLEEASTTESEPDEANPPEEKEQKSGGRDEKSVCVFDLNEEICTDDLEMKELVEDGARQEKLVCLDFDLNMSEVGDDTFVDTPSEKQVPVSLSVNSKDSVRSERVGLDLNSTGEDDDAVLEVAGQTFNPSPSTSSSQFHLPRRNFDLNDQPFSNNDFSEQFQKPSSSCTASFPRSDPFISIMGARVEVSREPAPPRAPLYHSNGNFHDLSGGIFGVSSLYSLSRCNMRPPSHAISFSPPPYGHGDSMMDPRAAPFGPTVSGSGPIMLPQYHMPVMMNMVAGPSRPPQMDLNLGLLDNGGNRDQPGILRHFLPPASRVDEHEHSGMFLQPLSGPPVGSKRKQPDGAWDFYSIQYEQQHQSPWK